MSARILTPRAGGASLEGTLTGADNKRNIAHTFTVPQGVGELRATMTFAPHVVAGFKNMIPLSVFDPAGFRGARHCHGTTHALSISATEASPGYLPGPIRAGEWTITLDGHVVMPQEPIRYRLDVEFGMAPNSGPSVDTTGPAPSRGSGWYRGDLHAHTFHSDAVWDTSDLAAWARRKGLDFVTLSDHNTLSGIPHLRALQSDNLLTLGGMEFTTFWGHALMLGITEWVDWRTDGGRGMATIAERVIARGGTFIVAHPRAIGDPYCSGCRWAYDEVYPGPARLVEVWNADWSGDSQNAEGLTLAFDWLNAGHRMAFSAGTDNHGRSDTLHYGYNHVYAEALTEEAILRAVRAGRNYISSGPKLILEARPVHGNRAVRQASSPESPSIMMGGTLPDGTPAAAFRVAWAEAPTGARLTLIADGKARRTLTVSATGEEVITLGPSDAAWCAATLTEASGRMLAITNPIWLR